MKRKCFTISKRAVAVLLILMMVMSFTGCFMLKDLATDYIQVTVRHELESETYLGGQANSYEITATVINNYIMDIPAASVSLEVPTGVLIVSGLPTRLETIPCDGNEHTFTWTVAVNKTTDDQNIDYSVSVESQLITTVTAFESIFVEGHNQNNNALDFTTDTWRFENYKVWTIPINQDDYNAMCLNLNNADRNLIKDAIKRGAGGQCYGMSITSILAKTGRLDLNAMEEGADNLHEVDKNKASKSTIAYYYITQMLSPAREKISEYADKSTMDKLEELEQLADKVERGGTPVLLCFYLTGGGHAVVAFGHEVCDETYNGTTYNNRILIYDNNFPNDQMYLYYNDEGACTFLYREWGRWEEPYEVADLAFLTADMKYIDHSNLEQSKRSVNSYLTARDNHKLEIISNKIKCTVDGMKTTAENIIAYYSIGGTNESDLNIAIKREEAEVPFTVRSTGESKDLDLSVSYDNYYMEAVTGGDTQVGFEPTGGVCVEGESENFNLEVTANEGNYATDWYHLSVSGKSGTDPSLKVTGEGYLVSGEDLKGVTVQAENETDAQKLKLKTDENSVLITQEDEKLCAKTDEDGDGKYETVIATGKTSDPDKPSSGSGFSLGDLFSGWSIAPWVIWLIVGIIVVGGTVAVIVAVCVSSKKKKGEQSPTPPPVIPPSAEKEPSADPAEPEQPAETEKKITTGVRILSGAMKDREFELTDGKTVLVGKDPANTKVLLDNSYTTVSRIHCSITYSATYDKYYVTDSSSNGTFFENGSRLVKNVRTSVARGTTLKLANDNCKIKLL